MLGSVLCTVFVGCEVIVSAVRFVCSDVVLASVVRIDADASDGPAWTGCCTSRSANPINPKRKKDLNADILMDECGMEGCAADGCVIVLI